MVLRAVSGVGYVTAFLGLPDGGLWAATRHAAVLVRNDDGWRPLPAAANLATRDVFALVPSPSGGVWVGGHGILLRVRPRPDSAGGWQVIEAPGAWHGMPTGGGSDLIEEEDGTLWITTSLGLVRLPPQARFSAAGATRVALVDARVDAVPVLSDRDLELPSRRNRLELRFAALSFRDPARIRYQVRLAPDAPWSDTRGQRPGILRGAAFVPPHRGRDDPRRRHRGRRPLPGQPGAALPAFGRLRPGPDLRCRRRRP